MSMRTTGMAAALGLLVSGGLSPVHAAVPPLGTREGELLCAGWTNVLASGALLTTGADKATAITAAGVFLGRLSVIAPDARYRLQDYFVAYDKLTPAEQEELARNCIGKLKEIGAVQGGAPDAKVY